jgi:hypothetical protein
MLLIALSAHAKTTSTQACEHPAEGHDGQPGCSAEKKSRPIKKKRSGNWKWPRLNTATVLRQEVTSALRIKTDAVRYCHYGNTHIEMTNKF